MQGERTVGRRKRKDDNNEAITGLSVYYIVK